MRPRTSKNAFTFVDLFAGIGGFRRAFETAGGECVFTSEWNEFALTTYRANHKLSDDDFRSDITKVAAADVPRHDILVAGFPCQPFSIAGVSKKNALGRKHGFYDETQGTLFFDIKRVLKARKPQAFLLENVKNIVSHDRGRTLEVIFRVLQDELDYNVTCAIIDGSHWVPQHRERTFIVGFKKKGPFDFASIPRPRNSPPTLGAVLHSPVTNRGIREIPEPHYTEAAEAKASAKYGLTRHLWNYLQTYADKHKAAGNGFGCSVFGQDQRARTLSARYYKDGSEILIRRNGNQTPRRLTPRECARLMGFDDRAAAIEDRFRIPVSDTQAYKQFGNSVVVPMATAIANAMIRHLNGTAAPLSESKRLPFKAVLAPC